MVGVSLIISADVNTLTIPPC